MGNYAYCPGETELRIILQESFDENFIEQVQLRQWISVDHCNLEILEKSSEEFIDLFCSKLSSLVRHDLQGWEKEVSKSPDKLKIEDISGYVTAVYEGNWWLGYVLQKNEELDEVKITFLHPFGSSASFSYPRNTDVLWVSIVDVLTKVNPVTPTGRS
ncbi:hypothetical protein AVEN_213590-1 [Araneus ventricosus]|uniref:Uncharacterized protein n=1 Tax=Araneus ventricosus TaxID=182803 RepID=A0A4Y2HPK1_ARAVE|nr:hypothetical protein AVEN_213590-1 [Araneus ventricosus]